MKRDKVEKEKQGKRGKGGVGRNVRRGRRWGRNRQAGMKERKWRVMARKKGGQRGEGLRWREVKSKAT